MTNWERVVVIDRLKPYKKSDIFAKLAQINKKGEFFETNSRSIQGLTL